MSTALASTFGLIVYGVLLAPVALMARASLSRVLGGLFAVLVMAVAFYQTGLFQQSALSRVPAVPARTVSLEDAQCRKIVQLMRQSGLEVDRSTPGEPKIVGAGAEQVPEQVRQVLIQCTDRSTAAENRAPL